MNNKGLALYNLGQYQEAIKWYDKALEIKPSFTSAMNNKGLALYNLGQYQEAIKWYDKALEINPHDTNAMNNKGLALYNLGQYQEAIKWYDKALEITPTDAVVLNNKGLAFNNLGQYQEAIKWYDKALEITPTDGDIINNKANALVKIFEQSSNNINHEVSYYPDINSDNNFISLANNENYQDHSYSLAFLKYLSIGQKLINFDFKYNSNDRHKSFVNIQLSPDVSYLEEAIKLYDQVLEQNPDDKTILINKGRTLGILEKYDDALQLFDKMLQKDPNNIDAMCNKAEVLEKTERHTEAKYYKERISDLNFAHECDLIETPSIVEEHAF
jgi:tetratricopeptide (TPR) repeat protein